MVTGDLPHTAPRVIALVGDLMDRSRLTGALGDAVTFATDAQDRGATGDVDVVVIDLARFGDAVAAVRAAAPAVRIVAFGPHVDDAVMARATSDGADVVLARSRFFRDVQAALASPTGR